MASHLLAREAQDFGPSSAGDACESREWKTTGCQPRAASPVSLSLPSRRASPPHRRGRRAGRMRVILLWPGKSSANDRRSQFKEKPLDLELSVPLVDSIYSILLLPPYPL